MDEMSATGGNVGGIGSAQKIQISEKYSLYIPDDEELELPAYDDYVERLENGDIFKVTSNSQARRTPERALCKFSVMSLEKTELPWRITDNA